MSAFKPTTLLEFFRDTFAPKYLTAKGRSPTLFKCYRKAIRRFGESLGAEPLLSDLTSKKFARFAEFLGGIGSAKQSEVRRQYIRRLWRIAHEMGLVTESPPTPRYLRAKWHEAEIAVVAKGECPKTLRQLYISFYKPLRLRGRADKSDHQYKVNIDHLQKFLGREPLLSDLDDELITSAAHWIVDSGRQKATANKFLSHILALWRLAARKRFVEQFPDVPKLIEPARIPKAWSADELLRLFDALSKTPGKIAGVPACDWWVALHHVLWWSAERIGAVLQLTWADVDIADGTLIVPAEARKFQTSDKFTELPPVAVAALRAIRKPERKLVFPWPKSTSLLYLHYSTILRRAGLPTDRKSKFHRMRKSAASHFEAAGGNATELLGHTSRRVTRNYLSPSIVKPQSTVGMLFSPAKTGGAA